ncbi:MAG: 30S ribosomal protein S6 [Lacipirellulaceae bacterium]
MATNVYEGLFLFDSNRFARERDTLPTEVESIITSAGGEVLVSRLWEERRLAYAIDGQRKGAYWLIYFRHDTQAITALNRACELHEGVMRHLVLKIHPRLVEPILAHASGVVLEEPTAESAEVAESVAEPAAVPAAE